MGYILIYTNTMKIPDFGHPKTKNLYFSLFVSFFDNVCQFCAFCYIDWVMLTFRFAVGAFFVYSVVTWYTSVQ